MSVVGVNLHVNEMAPSVSDSNRVRAGDGMFDVCVCGLRLRGWCVFCFVRGEHTWVLEQKSLTDISVFVCSVLLALQGGLYLTQTVTRRVKQILSNKVFVFVLSTLSILLD